MFFQNYNHLHIHALFYAFLLYCPLSIFATSEFSLSLFQCNAPFGLAVFGNAKPLILKGTSFFIYVDFFRNITRVTNKDWV